MNNVPSILHSKRFWTLVASILAMFIVTLVPDFQSAEEQLITLIAILGGVAVAGYSIEDALRVVYPTLADFVKETPNQIDDNIFALATIFLRARYPDGIAGKADVQVNVAPETVPVEVSTGGVVHG